MMEWISVEDRLPEIGVIVLVCHQYRLIQGSMWNGYAVCSYEGRDGLWEVGEQYVGEITHWVSLPKLPPLP